MRPAVFRVLAGYRDRPVLYAATLRHENIDQFLLRELYRPRKGT